MSGARLPQIRCAVCEKTADKVTVEVSRWQGTSTIYVDCHGDRDVMVITDQDLENDGEFWKAVGAGAVEGVAFTTKRLANLNRT